VASSEGVLFRAGTIEQAPPHNDDVPASETGDEVDKTEETVSTDADQANRETDSGSDPGTAASSADTAVGKEEKETVA